MILSVEISNYEMELGKLGPVNVLRNYLFSITLSVLALDKINRLLSSKDKAKFLAI